MEPEDGELSSSSDEVYTPLQRPEISVPKSKADNIEHKMTEILDDVDADETNSSSGQEDSSDNCLNSLKETKRKKRTKRTVMLRVQAADDPERDTKRARFKKYNIWTATAEEEALTETMRGCDVRHRVQDRSVENYNYHLVNGRKRRMEGGGMSDDEIYPMTKRGRDSSQDSSESGDKPQKSVKSRLGYRLILDLDDTKDREPADVGREMANKLFEEKDALLVRVVEVLGIETSVELYKETQKIEADGGMMINNGKRRRTPGGVFLFLLKQHEGISDEDRRTIFDEDKQFVKKQRKDFDSALRDRKVAELKQRLRKHENLPALSTRKELYLVGTSISENQCSNLSNPPPSPNAGQESSPEYKNSEIINHVTNDDVCLNKEASTSEESRNLAFKNAESANNDLDFLDLNCTDDMDLF